jgi:hypothetical protein
MLLAFPVAHAQDVADSVQLTCESAPKEVEEVVDAAAADSVYAMTSSARHWWGPRASPSESELLYWFALVLGEPGKVPSEQLRSKYEYANDATGQPWPTEVDDVLSAAEGFAFHKETLYRKIGQQCEKFATHACAARFHDTYSCAAFYEERYAPLFARLDKRVPELRASPHLRQPAIARERAPADFGLDTTQVMLLGLYVVIDQTSWPLPIATYPVEQANLRAVKAAKRIPAQTEVALTKGEFETTEELKARQAVARAKMTAAASPASSPAQLLEVQFNRAIHPSIDSASVQYDADAQIFRANLVLGRGGPKIPILIEVPRAVAREAKERMTVWELPAAVKLFPWVVMKATATDVTIVGGYVMPLVTADATAYRFRVAPSQVSPARIGPAAAAQFEPVLAAEIKRRENEATIRRSLENERLRAQQCAVILTEVAAKRPEQVELLARIYGCQ